MSRNTVSYDQACLENGIDLGAMAVGLAALSTAGARPFRPERWLDHTDIGGSAYYKVASGDTLSGLAALYLDNAARWQEIWAVQDADRTTNGSPDEIFTDEWLRMPAEALAAAIALNGGPVSHGNVTTGGGGGGGGGTGATDLTDTTTAKPLSSGTKTAIVVGLAALAALGVVLAVTR